MSSLKDLLNTYHFNFDGLELKDASFTLIEEERKIGEMTIRVMNGTTVRNSDDGIYIGHPDGTSQFINYSWFE